MSLESQNIKKLAISKIPILQSLNEETKERLLNRLILKEYRRNESILRSDQPGTDVMFVADGSVDVKKSNLSGKEVIVSRLEVGEILGEISLLTASLRTADVIAAEDCMVLILEAKDFENLLNSDSGFTKALLKHLAHRVAAASTKVTDLALLDVYCRVYKAIFSLAKKDSNNRVFISYKPTHKDLAAMVGTSREMVTRALSKLEEDEIIKTDSERITILGNLPNL